MTAPHRGAGEDRDERRPARPPRPRLASLGLVAGLALVAAGTVANKALGAGGTGRILVAMGAVLTLAAVWRPEWFGGRGRPRDDH